LGTRQREYRPQRNWTRWAYLIDALKGEGYCIGLVGQQATSFDSPLVDLRAWDVGNDAAANIEMLQQCKVYIGTDSGTSHLAALVSAPSVIFRYPDPWPHIDNMKSTTCGRLDYVSTGWNDAN